jgi:hypothetical protein
MPQKDKNAAITRHNDTIGFIFTHLHGQIDTGSKFWV